MTRTPQDLPDQQSSPSGANTNDSEALESESITGAFGERLKALRVYLFGDRGQKKFATHVNVPQSSLGKYENGVSPNVTALYRIISTTGVNARWLFTGEGQMFEEVVHHVQPPTHADAATRLGQGQSTLESATPGAGIEYWGCVTGSSKPTRIENLNRTLIDHPVPRGFHNRQFFAITLVGESMMPELMDSDLLVFYRLRSETKSAGSVAADGEARIDRLKPFSGRIVLARLGDDLEVRRMTVDAHRSWVALLRPTGNAVVLLVDSEGRYRFENQVWPFEVFGVLQVLVRGLGDTALGIVTVGGKS